MSVTAVRKLMVQGWIPGADVIQPEMEPGRGAYA